MECVICLPFRFGDLDATIRSSEVGGEQHLVAGNLHESTEDYGAKKPDRLSAREGSSHTQRSK
jgi:hypothetical protein